MKESARAKQAWADYLALPQRSLETLLERYRTDSNPPSRRLKTLADWSRFFGWQARLSVLADAAAKEAEARESAYRHAILEQGYGLKHERVRALKDLAAICLADLTEGDRRWLKDRKVVGVGEKAEVFDMERFNTAEVEQYRGLLDDIAKEKGERKTVTEITGKDGGDIGLSISDPRDILAARIASIAGRSRPDQGAIEPDPRSGG